MKETFDVSILTLKILSCIYRVQERCGSRLIAEILCGSHSKRVLAHEFDKLSTFNIVQDLSIDQVRMVIKVLLNQGLIYRAHVGRGLHLSQKGRQFLKNKPKLIVPRRILEVLSTPTLNGVIGPTQHQTFELWQHGKTLEEITQLRGLNMSTITSHLAELVSAGKITDISAWVSPDKLKHIFRVIKQNPNARLKTMKEQLPAEISYGQIKLVLAKLKKTHP